MSEGGDRMLESLRRFWRSLAGDTESADVPRASHAKKAEFRLFRGALLIGKLTYDEGLWTFAYSDDFKQKAGLRPLVQFPEKEKLYQSDELWPFFGMRIPSLKQPGVEKLVQTEHIDPTDSVALLKRFGRRTISNPYELAECD